MLFWIFLKLIFKNFFTFYLIKFIVKCGFYNFRVEFQKIFLVENLENNLGILNEYFIKNQLTVVLYSLRCTLTKKRKPLFLILQIVVNTK